MTAVTAVWFVAGTLGIIAVAPAHAASKDIDRALAKLRDIGPQAAGHPAAKEAWTVISGATAKDLPQLWAGIDGANPLAANWIIAACDTVAERELQKTGTLPKADLKKFVADRSHAPRARRRAYEWLLRVEPAAKAELLPKMLDDPSVELRYDAVAYLVEDAQRKLTDEHDQAIAMLQSALTASRDLEQVKQLRDLLKKEGIETDLSQHFGFVTNWKLIGPFDNVNQGGFDVVYPPEKEIDLAATYEGKGQNVVWIDHTTKHELGMVDLNTALGKFKGAAAYAVAELISPASEEVELRLGCINAPKIWLNGKLLFARHVYHAGAELDQYVVRGRLQAGKNQILLKICQNEMTQDWAQLWEFQFRVCDAVGTPIRLSPATAAQ